jgi:hypothetical protein
MLWTCPQCGAAVDTSADRCWGCQQPRPDLESLSQKVSTPVSEPDPEGAPADAVTESASALASASLRPLSLPSETNGLLEPRSHRSGPAPGLATDDTRSRHFVAGAAATSSSGQVIRPTTLDSRQN